MGAITITGFAGMLPSGNPKLIPDTASVLSENTFSRFGDLRPVMADSTVKTGVTASAKTLYRMSRKADGSSHTDGTTGWMTSALPLNYVRGPVARDATERTYYTGDGAPKATNLAGEIRSLGIAPPSSAPTVSVNTVDELTVDEAVASYSAAGKAVADAFAAHTVFSESTRFTPSNGSALTIDAGGAWNMYKVVANDAAHAYLLDAALHSGLDTNPAFIRILLTCRPAVREFNLPAITTALGAIDNPETLAPLFSTEQKTAIIAAVTAQAGAGAEYVVSRLHKINKLTLDWIALIDAGAADASAANAVTAFYARQDVLLEIESKRLWVLDQAGKSCGTMSGDETAGYVLTPASTTTLPASLAALVTTAGDGSKALAVSSAASTISAWLTANGKSLSAAVQSISSYSFVGGIQFNYNGTYQQFANYLAAEYGKVVNVDHWRSHPEFPTTASSVSASGVPAALTAAFNSAEKLVREIEAYDAKSVSADVLGPVIDSIMGATVASSFPTGVTRIETTFAYVQTWVSNWGEESAPSEASALVTCDQNDTRTVGRAGTAPANVTLWRLYRSNTGTQSSAYQLQGEYPAATASITDDKGGEYLDEACPSFGWLPPPAELKGLTGLPNGNIAGFVGSTLHFCESWHPYAWPADYDKPLPTPIVGLCAFGQTLFVGTEGKPYVVSGVDAGSMSEQILDFDQACLSARSIVSLGSGVAYAAPDGLALVGAGSAPTILTQSALTKAAWNAYLPAQMFGVLHDQRIYQFHPAGCLVWDMATGQLFQLSVVATSAFVDAATDTLYYVAGTAVYALFGSSSKRTAKWYSKTFNHNKPTSLGALIVEGDISAPVTVRVYADEVLVRSCTFSTSDPQRLPAKIAKDWRFEIETAANQVVFVCAATSMLALQQVP